jgi:hypothetical protein
VTRRLAYCGALGLSFAWFSSLPTAVAAEGTELASAMDEDDPFDLFVSVEYAYAAKRAAIKREFAGDQFGEPGGPMPVVKDFLFTHDRHTVTPRLQIGLFHDLELSLALPIIISDSRHYDFDQRDTPCDFDGDDATCINETNSPTFRDGILTADMNQLGYDAKDPTVNFAPGSERAFTAVDRSGLDQIHLGVAWAPLSQERDDTKPTWVIGSELRIDIGEPMRFDRLNPTLEDSVGRGYSEVVLRTSVSKRMPWAEPFMELWWQAPLDGPVDAPTRANQTVDSQFWDIGGGQDNTSPQQHAGVKFGFNGIPWQNRAEKQYLAIEVRGSTTAHFQGRGYSEMWEVFAYGGDPGRADAPLLVDYAPGDADNELIGHPGVTTIENYLSFGGRLGIRGQMGERAKFNASFNLDYDQSHRISWDDAGSDDNENGQVDPGTNEVNPLFNQLINLPGRRYLVDESVTYSFIIAGTLMF